MQDDGKAEQIGEIVESASQVPVDSDSKIRSMAWHLLLWGIRSSGAAFIKWGQWSATREDMFPAEFCSILSELHDSAPVHSWEESKREIEQSFGKSVEDLFESIDHEPLASGSIAQVSSIFGPWTGLDLHNIAIVRSYYKTQLGYPGQILTELQQVKLMERRTYVRA